MHWIIQALCTIIIELRQKFTQYPKKPQPSSPKKFRIAAPYDASFTLSQLDNQGKPRFSHYIYKCLDIRLPLVAAKFIGLAWTSAKVCAIQTESAE